MFMCMWFARRRPRRKCVWPRPHQASTRLIAGRCALKMHSPAGYPHMGSACVGGLTTRQQTEVGPIHAGLWRGRSPRASARTCRLAAAQPHWTSQHMALGAAMQPSHPTPFTRCRSIDDHTRLRLGPRAGCRVARGCRSAALHPMPFHLAQSPHSPSATPFACARARAGRRNERAPDPSPRLFPL